MAKVKVTQVRSQIRRAGNQKKTLEALGLGKIGKVVEHEDSPSIMGMIRTVAHLISVEKI